VLKNTCHESGRIVSHRSKDSRMVLEEVVAGVIGGQVKGCGAILASLAHVMAIHKKWKHKKKACLSSITNTGSKIHFTNCSSIVIIAHRRTDARVCASLEKCFHCCCIPISRGHVELGEPILCIDTFGEKNKVNMFTTEVGCYQFAMLRNLRK